MASMFSGRRFSRIAAAIALAYPASRSANYMKVAVRPSSNAAGKLRSRATVRGLRVTDGQVAAVEMDGGREETADLYLLAVPHDVALRSAARGASRALSPCFRICGTCASRRSPECISGSTAT